MFGLIRFLISLAMLAAFIWFAVSVPLGKRTLWGHTRAIFGSQEAKDLAEGTKEEAEKVARKVKDEMHQPDMRPAHSPEAKPAHPPEAKPAHSPETKPAHSPEAKPAHSPEAKPAHSPEAKPAHSPETEPAHPPEVKPGPA